MQAVRDLAPSIAGRSGEIEAARRLPADLLGQLKEAGCVRMLVPQSHGGYEEDMRTSLNVIELLAHADGSTGWTTMIAAEAPQIFANLSREHFDALYSSGPDVIVGGGFSPQGLAHVQQGGYRVMGRWGFATGCQHADWLFGNCVVMEDGRPRPGPMEGVPTMRAMLFRQGGMQIIDTWSVLGLRGTGSHDVAVENAVVPEPDTFDIFLGKTAVAGPAYVAPVLHFAVHMGAVALGIAQGALDDLTALATDGKRRLYARTPLAESQLFKFRLGRADTSVHAARAYLYAFGDELWHACTHAPETAQGLTAKTSATLAWATSAAIEAVDACYHAAGASSVRDSASLQRRFRDIHTFSQHAAAVDAWFCSPGAALLGQPTGFWY